MKDLNVCVCVCKSENIMAVIHCLPQNDEQDFQGAFHVDLKHQMVVLHGQKIAAIILVLRKQSAVREDAAESSLTCSSPCLKNS